MILSIIALIASILALAYQIYTTREEDNRWNEYFENKKKQRQMLQDGDIVIENKIKRTIIFNQQEQ
jgi:hypothetical protein